MTQLQLDGGRPLEEGFHIEDAHGNRLANRLA